MANPIKVNGYSSKKLIARRAQRRVQAEQRQAKYDVLSNKEKISLCHKRRGDCKVELMRLRKQEKAK